MSNDFSSETIWTVSMATGSLTILRTLGTPRRAGTTRSMYPMLLTTRVSWGEFCGRVALPSTSAETADPLFRLMTVANGTGLPSDPTMRTSFDGAAGGGWFWANATFAPST